jgi:putative redox protein
MEVTADSIGDARFELEARGHRLVCDQPRENGGSDGGMTPPEFLLAALASCAGYYAAEYLKARALPAENLRVRVTAGKALRPARIEPFHIEITAPGLDERHEHGVLRAVKSCLIHNTLLNIPTIGVTVNGATQEQIPHAA